MSSRPSAIILQRITKASSQFVPKCPWLLAPTHPHRMAPQVRWRSTKLSSLSISGARVFSSDREHGNVSIRHPPQSSLTHLRLKVPYSSSVNFIRCFSVRQKMSDTPLPFLESKAARFKVDDAYSVEYDVNQRQRYAFPLGITLFAFIMYFGFLRKYGDSDSSVVEFLTQDISSKLPEGTRKQIMSPGIHTLDDSDSAGIDAEPEENDSDKDSTT